MFSRFALLRKRLQLDSKTDLTDTFCLVSCIELFLYGATSESVCLNFSLISLLWYLDSVQQFLGSYGSNLLAVDPVQWAIWLPQAETLQFGTWGLLLSSSANFVCGRQHCATTWFTFFIFLTRVEEVQKWTRSLLMLSNSDEKFVGEFLLRLWQFEVRRYFWKIWVVIYWRKFPKKWL